MSDNTSNQASAIACDLSIFNESQREQHGVTTKALFATVKEVADLPDGYAFRLPGESQVLHQVVDFIANERLCCPFIQFQLRVEPHAAGVWLQLTGGTEVKQLLAMEFEGYLAI